MDNLTLSMLQFYFYLSHTRIYEPYLFDICFSLRNIPIIYALSLCHYITGVYGGLDLHGKEVTTPWTTLNTTVQAGETILTLNAPVDWEVGNEIVVAPTGYNVWETETFKITAISTANNQSVVTLNDTVTFRHIGK